VSDDTIAVLAENLSVRYKIRSQRNLNALQIIRSGFRTRATTYVDSLMGIDLRIDTGEVVGLVGRNGAGKSTLLNSIAGVIAPATGRVLVRAQPALLSVGAALIPKLSGNRNITIGALAMGIDPGEIPEVRAFVHDFTELGNALDRPLNTYSTGMRARLAFALTTYRLPDIMLIDEALAVGDKQFKSKSLARVREMQERAGTVVMATHNMREIRRTCNRVIWLDAGGIVMDGPVKQVLAAYDPDDLN